VIRRVSVLGTGCLAGLWLGVALPAPAQQGEGPEAGGPVLTFGVSVTASATDNYNLDPDREEDATLLDTRLSVGYLHTRPNDVLRLDASGLLHADTPPGVDNSFDDRFLSLGYDRQGADAALSFGTSYRLVSVDSRDPFDVDRDPEEDPIDETDLIRDRGDEETIEARFTLETGLTAPLGLTLTGRYRDRSFTDTTDPELFDSETLSLLATTRLTLDPVTEARLVLSVEEYSADDAPQTDRQTSRATLGLSRALSGTDTIDLALGVSRIETDETIGGGPRRSDTETGGIGSLAFSRELTRGTIGTSFEIDESENGQTATWLVSRDLPLPRGALALSVGATRDVADDIQPAGRLRLTHEMPRSTLIAALSQDVRTSDRSNELRTTRASLDYIHEINALSQIGLSANFAEISRSGGPALNDTSRTDLRATYSHRITRDWLLSSGYEYRIRDEDTVGTATSNRIFLTLERDFTIRP
jgi:hypothetical protein